MKVFPILVLAFALVTESAFAREDNWIVHRHTRDDGLTNNAVRAVLRDSKGYVWMGTSNGLNRYDGHDYLEVVIDGGVPDNNYITSLLEDSNGRIWIGTASGVCLYEPGKTNAVRFSPMAGDDFQVYQIIRESAGTILIPDRESGFFRIDTEKFEVERIEKGENNLKYSPVAMCQDVNGVAWFINDDGTLYRSTNRLKSAEPVVLPADVSPFAGKRIHRMFYASGYILVGMTENVLTMNIRTGEYNINKSISNIYAILPASENEFWAACDNGIVVYDADLNVLRNFLMTDLPGGGDGRQCPTARCWISALTEETAFG